MTKDVKHYEDCEQLFLSTGLCYVIEALMQFFMMKSKDDQPTKNTPAFHNIHVDDNRKKYLDEVSEKFVDTFLLCKEDGSPSADEQEDGVMNYSLSLLRYFFVIADYKDAVREGNGRQLLILHKQLLQHFKSVPGFNAYAIEMLISIIQSDVFLSQAESHQITWSATVNWKGGSGKNIEIDLLQENRNKDLKNLIKGMGANKTTNAIKRASRAAGGVRHIVENFDNNASLAVQSSGHTHRSSESDEEIVMADLRDLKPFELSPGRRHNSFPGINPDNLSSLQRDDFSKWLSGHKKNLLMNAPLQLDNDDDDEPLQLDNDDDDEAANFLLI